MIQAHSSRDRESDFNEEIGVEVPAVLMTLILAALVSFTVLCASASWWLIKDIADSGELDAAPVTHATDDAPETTGPGVLP